MRHRSRREARSCARPDPSLRIRLERDQRAPALGRAAIRELMDAHEVFPPARSSTIVLLVSELLSNAVMHSDALLSSPILLCAHVLEEGAISVEVIDQGSGFEGVPRDPALHEGGYGLYLIDREASRWGVEIDGETRVWFEITGPAQW